MVAATWLAIVLSFVGTVFVGLTFWEQRKVSRAELRAYVGAEAVGLFVNGSDGGAIAELKITNSGQTPAFNTRWAGNIVIRTERQVELDLNATIAANNYPEGRATSLSLHSGRSATAVLYGAPKLNLAEYRKAAQEEDGLALYVFGTVWYDDAFERAHYTNFCFEAETLLALGDGKPKFEEANYSMTPFHNDSD